MLSVVPTVFLKCMQLLGIVYKQNNSKEAGTLLVVRVILASAQSYIFVISCHANFLILYCISSKKKIQLHKK